MNCAHTLVCPHQQMINVSMKAISTQMKTVVPQYSASQSKLPTSLSFTPVPLYSRVLFTGWPLTTTSRSPIILIPCDFPSLVVCQIFRISHSTVHSVGSVDHKSSTLLQRCQTRIASSYVELTLN